MEDLLGVSYGMLLAMKNILRAVHNEVNGQNRELNDDQEYFVDLERELEAQSRLPGNRFVKAISKLSLLVKEMFLAFNYIKSECMKPGVE